ncbi:hypothetical protein [Streptomyces sp. bgisy022]
MRVWREYWQQYGVRYGLFQAFMALLWAVSGMGLFGGLTYLAMV